MQTSHRRALRVLSSTLAAFGLTLAAGAAIAQAPATPATPTAPAAAAIAASAPASAPAEHAPQQADDPANGLRVIEDDRVRIEELRVRGQVVRVTVHSKIPGVKPYEVQLRPPGSDPNSPERANAGKSAWRLFSF